MKLYFSPGACSLAPHIVLNELGMKYELEKVDLATKKTASGDFTEKNPKGYVPALWTDKGELLTEGAVIMQYLADQKPEAGLIPKAGTWERYRAMEWLNFVATEMHKGIGSFFSIDRMVPNKEGAEQYKEAMKKRLAGRFDFLSNHLKDNQFLMGSQFTAPDAYLFTVMNWTKHVNIDLSKWPALMAYMERVQSRPSVAKAQAAEKEK